MVFALHGAFGLQNSFVILKSSFVIRIAPMPASFNKLLRLAETEVARAQGRLPADVREAAGECAVLYESIDDALDAGESIEDDLLGLFEGLNRLDPLPAGPDDMPRIRLFLDNLWDYAGGDDLTFRKEVRKTYLHELGHYLGWDEAAGRGAGAGVIRNSPSHQCGRGHGAGPQETARFQPPTNYLCASTFPKVSLFAAWRRLQTRRSLRNLHPLQQSIQKSVESVFHWSSDHETNPQNLPTAFTQGPRRRHRMFHRRMGGETGARWRFSCAGHDLRSGTKGAGPIQPDGARCGAAGAG